MQRRHFLQTSALAGGLNAFPLALLAQPGDPLKPFYLPPNPQPLLPGPGGIATRTLVRHAQTNGQFSCVELAVAPKKMGPAPHVHRDLDELMHVTEGTVSILVGEEVYEVKAGGWHLRPRQITHTFWNATDQPARAVDMYFNQPFEEFLDELNGQILPTIRANGWAQDSKEAAALIDALHAKFGITMYHDRRAALVKKYGLKG